MRKIFTIHTDRGHGWLRVTIAEITQLRLHVNDFSWYSYRKGDDLYLEEDCDMARFMNAYRAIYGSFPVIKNEHCEGNSPIRSYARLKQGARI